MLREMVSKRLTKNWLLTLLFSEVLVFFITFGFHGAEPGFEAKQGIIIEGMVLVIWIFMLALCSLTLYLNIIDRIRNSKLYAILSFFFLPGAVSVTMIIIIMWSWSGNSWPFIMATLSFMLVHSYYSVKFLKTGFEV